MVVAKVDVARFRVDLQHGTLCRHHERAGINTVVLGQCDVGAAVDLRRGHLTRCGHDADVHVRAGCHARIVGEFLLAVVGHGRCAATVLVDDQTVVARLTAAALRPAVASARVRASAVRSAVGVSTVSALAVTALRIIACD